MAAFDFQRGHFNLLDQTAFKGVYSIQTIHHMVLIHVGRRVAEGAHGVHCSQGTFTRPLEATIDALWFVNNHNRRRGFDQVNGLLAACILALFIEVVHILFVDRADCCDHDLNGRACREIAHLTKLRGVIQEILIPLGFGIQILKMITGNFQRFVCTFFDRHGWDDDHEFREPVGLVQLENRAQIDIGFACARLHLDREISGSQNAVLRQAVFHLNGFQVVQQVIVHQFQTVANA